MEPFVRTTAVAAAIQRNNIDTDQIAPGLFAANTPKEKHAEALFRNMRYLTGEELNPEFVLNRSPWDKAEILVVGENFGCGSSREAAAKALRAFGIRAVIAPSFGGILFNNCFRNGIVPVVLPKEVVAHLADDADHAGDGARLTVDLEALTVTDNAGQAYAFTAPEQQRTMLLHGLDEIDFTLGMRAELEAFWSRDQQLRPWVYEPGKASDAR
ncbi:3-isopropylmalate dehydratase, small subunit [Paraburkholderia fungorum]|uniref:3-isopropylmalate dehydratase n=1 Tax=Paraburkholderia fungorum TaxID=134537 RepID=A0A1H1JZH0_9BURK|nr:3-isopropylmalate dehydratase small subunit [Paraburkholderia fungorum]SDR55461.1 3-isopropylmalate dehydratase, small subunit [Paraburkholderia fungorum]